MAVGTAAAILGATVIASGAVGATSSVIAGQRQGKWIERQSTFNAQVYEQQAEMIKEQKKLQDYQFNRQAAKGRGSIVARTAGGGLNLSGSPMALLIDTESQMLLDKAVEDYNLDVQSNYAKSGAAYTRQTASEQARLSRFTGYSNAFTSLMNTGVNAYTAYRIGKL